MSFGKVKNHQHNSRSPHPIINRPLRESLPHHTEIINSKKQPANQNWNIKPMRKFQIFFAFKFFKNIADCYQKTRHCKNPELRLHNHRIDFIILNIPVNPADCRHKNPRKRKKRVQRSQNCERQTLFYEIRHCILNTRKKTDQKT